MRHALGTILFVSVCACTLRADLLDLRLAGASDSASAAIGGIFRVDQIPVQATGTGLISSFLRIHKNNQERGYNTSLGGPLDDMTGNFTRALLLGEIPVVNLWGTNYRQFLLDINQNSDSELSLNQIQIFQTNQDRMGHSIIEASAATDALLSFPGTPAATEIFRMNNPNLAQSNPGRHEIQLDYSLNAGSGSGDMFLYVLDSAFDPGKSNVILFSQFGGGRGVFASNDGFEEWSVLQAPAAIPEPASVFLLVTVTAGIALTLRKRG